MRRLLLLLCMVTAASVPAPAGAAIFRVTSPADRPDVSRADGICKDATGACTLRAAIQQANSTSAPDVVAFAVSTGVQTIAPSSPLPKITAPLTIDGSTQPNAKPTAARRAPLCSDVVHHPCIVLDGSKAGPSEALWITAGGSTVRGLVINGFEWDGSTGEFGDGIVLQGRGGNVVEGNYIGTDVSGTVLVGNAGAGVYIWESPNNVIGGTTIAARNVLSGRNYQGVVVQGRSSTHNLIEGDYIGVDASGARALSNFMAGVLLYHSGTGNIIGGTVSGARNVISGNGATLGGADIWLMQSDGNQIIGNFIGPDSTGTRGLFYDYSSGVEVEDSSSNIIGGSRRGAGNLITSTDGGVIVSGGSNNRILGNLIGTDVTGSRALGTGWVGIVAGGSGTVIGGANGARNVIAAAAGVGIRVAADGTLVDSNLIGTNSAGESGLGNAVGGIYLLSRDNSVVRNVISGNGGYGLLLVAYPDSGASGNRIEGNLVGVAPGGVLPLGNHGDGVYVQYNAANPTAPEPGANRFSSNTVAYNGGAGFFLEGGQGELLTQNLIFGNVGLGIDLRPLGPTVNDPLDADHGPNALQNYPVISSVTLTGSTLVVSGTLKSAPVAPYTIEFFASASCDASGFGQGARFLGSAAVTTNKGGDAAFSVSLPAGTPVLRAVTATATSVFGDTSEFARCVAG